MIGLEEYKKALGAVTDDLPEEEIIKTQKIQDELAELFYVMWRNKRLEDKKVIINLEKCEVSSMKLNTALYTAV